VELVFPVREGLVEGEVAEAEGIAGLGQIGYATMRAF
jgi:hypothetical protein